MTSRNYHRRKSHKSCAKCHVFWARCCQLGFTDLVGKNKSRMSSGFYLGLISLDFMFQFPVVARRFCEVPQIPFFDSRRNCSQTCRESRQHTYQIPGKGIRSRSWGFGMDRDFPRLIQPASSDQASGWVVCRAVSVYPCLPAFGLCLKSLIPAGSSEVDLPRIPAMKGNNRSVWWIGEFARGRFCDVEWNDPDSSRRASQPWSTRGWEWTWVLPQLRRVHLQILFEFDGRPRGSNQTTIHRMWIESDTTRFAILDEYDYVWCI